MPEKIEIQKYKKISKGTKNVRNPHILHTLPNLHFFDFFKIILDLICLEYWVNRLIALKGCKIDAQKNWNPKI